MAIIEIVLEFNDMILRNKYLFDTIKKGCYKFESG